MAVLFVHDDVVFLAFLLGDGQRDRETRRNVDVVAVCGTEKSARNITLVLRATQVMVKDVGDNRGLDNALLLLVVQRVVQVR